MTILYQVVHQTCNFCIVYCSCTNIRRYPLSFARFFAGGLIKGLYSYIAELPDLVYLSHCMHHYGNDITVNE